VIMLNPEIISILAGRQVPFIGCCSPHYRRHAICFLVSS
jgi:hypothetical protein